MRPEQVINALLLAAGVVTAIVGAGSAAKIYPGRAPQNVATPFLVIEHIDSQELDPITATAGQSIVRSRIQVTAMCADTPAASAYAQVKALLEQVRLACSFKSGSIAGVQVVSVLRDSSGPDLRDDDLGVVYQSVDFLVTHYQS